MYLLGSILEYYFIYNMYLATRLFLIWTGIMQIENQKLIDL